MQKKVWDDLWSKSGEFNSNEYFECVVDSIKENINVPLKDANILEAGAGMGTTSLQLAKEGANVTLLDYSQIAIDKMDKMFKANNINASFLCNDIRKIDVEDNTYDVVFNSGVLEHFSYDEQVEILKELKRVCKPNGRVIVFVPNAKCLLYRTWKYVLESIGKWQYGIEVPIVSLENQFKDAGLNLAEEFSTGFEDALGQFRSFKETQTATDLINLFYNSVSDEEKRLFEGYLVCSIGEK